ncbi:hypothetical protein AMS68_002467 [Peltaster fructicola]|uniref:Uncharacterized protein n=1 Tax=Peltaster fructicola TaxID=286661 RepID=A0A6H0XR57_9PEZI|nr:hypothetical protein AMS68_002467 [Peltaster fructicola]
MPADTHSFARRSSTWDAASTSTESTLLKGSETQSSRKSSLSKAIDKVKSRLGKHGEALADDEEDYERQRVKAEKKEKRREEYEQLGLDERVKFGTIGAGGFNSA